MQPQSDFNDFMVRNETCSNTIFLNYNDCCMPLLRVLDVKYLVPIGLAKGFLHHLCQLSGSERVKSLARKLGFCFRQARCEKAITNM